MLKKVASAARRSLPFLALILASLAFAQVKPMVQRVAVQGNEQGIQVQITSTQPIATQTQLLTGPDRLVIDFPGAAPGSQLRGLAVNQGGIKDVRVGLFSSEPPTTRVVVDLSSASPYEIVPNGNSVILKVGGGNVDLPGVKPLSPQPVSGEVLAAAAPPPPPNLQVNFQAGELTIHAAKASLAEVLFAIQQRTGADIPIPAGAEQEPVVADVGPGPAKDVLTALLNGTRFNFIVVGSGSNDGSLRSVILSPKSDLGTAMPAGMQPVSPVNQDDGTPDIPQEQVQLPPPTEAPPPPLQPNEAPGQPPNEMQPNQAPGQPNQGEPNMNQVPTEEPSQNTGPGAPPVQAVPDENGPPQE